MNESKSYRTYRSPGGREGRSHLGAYLDDRLGTEVGHLPTLFLGTFSLDIQTDRCTHNVYKNVSQQTSS